MGTFSEPQDRTFTDAGVKWRVREIEPKPGRLPVFLRIAIFESERGRRWAQVGAGMLRHLSIPELVEVLDRSQPVPLGRTIRYTSDPQPRVALAVLTPSRPGRRDRCAHCLPRLIPRPISERAC